MLCLKQEANHKSFFKLKFYESCQFALHQSTYVKVSYFNDNVSRSTTVHIHVIENPLISYHC